MLCSINNTFLGPQSAVRELEESRSREGEYANGGAAVGGRRGGRAGLQGGKRPDISELPVLRARSNYHRPAHRADHCPRLASSSLSGTPTPGAVLPSDRIHIPHTYITCVRGRTTITVTSGTLHVVRAKHDSLSSYHIHLTGSGRQLGWLSDKSRWHGSCSPPTRGGAWSQPYVFWCGTYCLPPTKRCVSRFA